MDGMDQVSSKYIIVKYPLCSKKKLGSVTVGVCLATKCTRRYYKESSRWKS